MPAYKDNRQGTWYASFYFENWQGVKQKKLKRGFSTKKDLAIIKLSSPALTC